MSSLKDQVGTLFGPLTGSITQKSVDEFKKTVGADFLNSSELPPTYMTRFHEGLFGIVQQVGIKIEQVLHAEQGYEFLRPISIGTDVEYLSKLIKVQEKNSGDRTLIFIYVDTFYYPPGTDLNQAMVIAHTTLVVR